MALVLADRVRETTTTAGTGTITLLGAVPSCQSFAVVGNGNTTYYTIVAQSGTEWEVGIGTYTSSGTTLSRDTVLASSNGGSLVNFSAGTKDVFVDYPASKAVYEDAAGNVDGYPITGGTINNTTIGATTPSTGVFTDASVTTASGQSAFNENDTITGWIYSGNSFSFAAQEATPSGLFIGSNGTKMYVNGSSGDDVNEYTLSTAWDITTATFVTAFSTNAQDTSPQDIFFKPDGLSMFVMGGTNDTVFQYTLGTAWDVSTASYASKSFSVTSQESSPLGLWFKPDGLVMYVVGNSTDSVFQYTLGTAWDVSTASYASISFSFASQETTPQQVNLSADGLKMWVVGSTGDDIWEYTLGTAWDVSTAIPVNNFYVGFQENNPTGLFIDSTAANRVYVMGSTTDTVYQYYTAANSLKLDTEKLYVDGQLSVNENFVAGQNAYVDGALTVQGAVTASSITAGPITASNLSSSGTTSLATSTAAQTVSLGAGATISGALKTINIGTTGVSGSTTDINLGSAVSGSLGSIVANGAFTATGQTSLGGVAGAEGLRVLNTASSVNYFQISGSTTTTAVRISGQGSDTNIPVFVSSKGASQVSFYTNNIAQEQMRVSHTASAVNYVQVTGGATGVTPAISFQGSDGNIGGSFVAKGGNGTFRFLTNTTLEQLRILNTASAVNYATVTGSAASSGVVFSVAGTDTNVDLNLTTKGTGSLVFNTGNGIGFKVYDGSGGAAQVNYFQTRGRGTGVGPFFITEGNDTNVSANFGTKGTGVFSFLTSGASVEQFRIAHTASAVNYVQVTGAATGTGPTISSQGSDANARLLLNSKGTSSGIDLLMNNSRQVFIGTNGSAVNYLLMGGTATGFGPAISSAGSDTNIPLVLQPKGTGALQAQQTDSTATGGNARGANAVDWQTARGAAAQVASAQLAVLAGGTNNTVNGALSVVSGGGFNGAFGQYAVISGGAANNSSQYGAVVVGGQANAALGWFNFIGGGFSNSANPTAAVTTQATTTVTSGSTAVTLSGSNANIRVGQLITGTGINTPTYVAAISGTSLTLSQNAASSGTPTLSFYTPHGVVVGGGNNQATGSYSFIGGGGDAGTAANRNVASADWSTVGGGVKNVASGIGAVIAGGGYDGTIYGNTASGLSSVVSGGIGHTASSNYSTVLGGTFNSANGQFSTVAGYAAIARGITGNTVFSPQFGAVAFSTGVSQTAILVIGKQTTDATTARLTSDSSATGGTTNQVILPNNSAYTFRGEIVSGVTGGGNSKSWTIEGLIKRGANAASTTLVGSTVTSMFADVGAATWAIALSADTTNGGLAVTFTGQAATTIRTVCQIRTTEMTY